MKPPNSNARPQEAPALDRALQSLSSWVARRQRLVEIAIGCLLLAYLLHVLKLAKFFSLPIDPARFRDLGILWYLSDYVFANLRYAPEGYYFPPPNAIILHLYGLMNRDLAFRLYLLSQAVNFVLLLWMWSRLLQLAARPLRFAIVLTAVLATLHYVHFEFHMHNLNLMSLTLVSAAVVFQRSAMGPFCYGLSLAIKPYSSVLVLPWMVWQGHYGYALRAVLWLLLFFLALPVLWFGVDATITLYKDWVHALGSAGSSHPNPLSVKLGLAALLGVPIDHPSAALADRVALAIWVAGLAAFFLPTLLRRGPGAAFTTAAELAAILLAALPVGALQQPARNVALLPAMLVVAAAAFAEQRSRWSRIALIGVLAFVGIAPHAVAIGPPHHLLTLPLCMAALAGLAIARHEPGRNTESAVPQQPTGAA